MQKKITITFKTSTAETAINLCAEQLRAIGGSVTKDKDRLIVTDLLISKVREKLSTSNWVLNIE